MSNILIKKVQDTLITTPASNYVKFFSNSNDGGKLYYKDSSGVATPVDTESDPLYVEVTYSQLYSLGASSSFVTASYYLITDFDSVYEQPDFYFDGKPKTSLSVKGKPAIPYQPILVMATSYNTLSPDAYQPYYPKDKIKYDFTWNRTELDHSAKGRITERIDEFGNRTDYDHRTIRFKRYLDYSRDIQLTGTILEYDCVTGTLKGTGTLFISELSHGDVVLIDSVSDMSKGYNMGFKVRNVVDDLTVAVEVDSLYVSGVPSSVSLNNGALIVPTNYSFASKSYDFYMGSATGLYNQYKEVYFGQGDAPDVPGGDYDHEVYTFGSSSFNNKIGNYTQLYSLGVNNTLVLSNNVFGSGVSSNDIGDECFNNTIGDSSSYNKIGNRFNCNSIGYMSSNVIGTGFIGNISTLTSIGNNVIGDSFGNNYINTQSFSYNSINAAFISNIIDAPSSDFLSNSIDTSVYFTNFSSATHVFGDYNCTIFKNSLGVTQLSYFASSLTIDPIDA